MQAVLRWDWRARLWRAPRLSKAISRTYKKRHTGVLLFLFDGMVKESVNISKYKYIRAMSMWQGDKVVTRSSQTTDWCFPEDFDNLFPLFS